MLSAHKLQESLITKIWVEGKTLLVTTSVEFNTLVVTPSSTSPCILFSRLHKDEMQGQHPSPCFIHNLSAMYGSSG